MHLLEGKIIITLNIRGSKDIVKQGENGMVVEIDDTVNLMNTIFEVLENEQMRIGYGEKWARKI